MTSTSTRAVPPRAAAGFTLLEIMVTVLIMALLLPILAAREQATARAHRAKNLLEALQHAEALLAERVRDVQPVDSELGVVEEAPYFRYELTLENFDLSTGLSEDQEEEDDWRNEQPIPPENLPSDAGVPDEDERADPHLVRRFELRLLWAHEQEDGAERELLLEGYLPRVWQDDPERLLDDSSPSAEDG